MRELVAYKLPDSVANIDQLPMQRDWMDRTFDRHSYNCFPMSLANRLGWGISFNEDISFVWDGIESSEDKHIEIVKGGDFVSTRRANRTVSLDTGIYFSPHTNVSLLTMPPPNIFLDGVQCISTIVSSSALIGPLPIALMVTKTNSVITIPAGTIVASVLPISLTEMNETTLNVINKAPGFMSDPNWNRMVAARGVASQELNSKGEWTHFYRDAVDHQGNSYGEHEVKRIIMRVDEN